MSHQPGDKLVLLEGFNIDKVLHAIAYGSLAASAIYFLVPIEHKFSKTGLNLAIIFFCVFYGVTDEWHQSFIPNRTASHFDVAADGVGAVLSVLLWRQWQKHSILNRTSWGK